MTAEQLRTMLNRAVRFGAGDPAFVAADAIRELEARDREIEQAQAREEAWRADIRDRTYELSQAKREIAEVREHAAALAEAVELLKLSLEEPNTHAQYLRVKSFLAHQEAKT